MSLLTVTLLTTIIAPSDPVQEAMKATCLKGIDSACHAYYERYKRNQSRDEFSMRTLHATALPKPSKVKINYSLTSLAWDELNTHKQIPNEKALELYNKYN